MGVHNWGPLEGACQRCTECGRLHMLPCAHQWTVAESHNVTKKSRYYDEAIVVRIIEVHRCNRCGKTESMTTVDANK